MLPDSADPMDIRYNVINWVHRSTRGWSYGASVVDPRTGEIIKGQVSLGSLRVRQDYLIAQGLLAPFGDGIPATDPMLAMALARLEQLSAHEIGHTLGLMHNYASSVNDRASVMDYPHPKADIDPKGNIDLRNAYDDKIGEWDKIAITWGYQDFPKGTDDRQALEGIIRKGIGMGLLFISDRDARAAGGAHPQAHLWDNGRDAATELTQILKIRRRALDQFGLNNIREGMPVAMLEDVLVPVYLSHRYQAEAAVKTIGGVDYAYNLKGDGQPAPRIVSAGIQRKSLAAILECLSANQLALPASIVDLIPPRPANYDLTRELFKKRTGLVFDALSPAETAADLPLSLLFHPERLSRLVQQEAVGGLGVREMTGKIIDATWKAPRKKGMEELIQQQTEQIVLTYLLAASVDEQVSFPARAVVRKRLQDLKRHIDERIKASASDPAYSGHLEMAIERMKTPEKAKPTQHAAIPPGAPIGCWQD
jgi:hypothetical protein